jgi:hypothetical protein
MSILCTKSQWHEMRANDSGHDSKRSEREILIMSQRRYPGPLALHVRRRFVRRYGFLAAVFFAACSGTASADVVKLRDEGVIVGKVLNPQRGALVKIETEDGTTLEIDRKLVIKIRQTMERDLEYAKKLIGKTDSLEDHRSIVEECMTRQMVLLAKAHRERIVELDPADRSSWENLGYFKDDATGKYLRREVVMYRRGKIKGVIKGDKDKWYTWEEKALLDWDQKVTMQRVAAEKELDARIKGLSGNTVKKAESQAYFQKLNNPLLINELAARFGQAAPSDRGFYLGLLKQMPIRSVAPTMIRIALEHLDTVVVNECRDFLASADEQVREMALSSFAAVLREPKSNTMWDRAAYCMTPINDKRLIGVLINSLLSESVNAAGSPGAISPGVSRDGGISFFNGAPPPTTRVNQHPWVLAALTELTGENFGYDQREWGLWFSRTYAFQNLDLRRDEN